MRTKRFWHLIPGLALLVMPMFAAASADAADAKLPVIKTLELKAKLDKHEKLQLVEALELKYYKKGHLPGAIRLTDASKEAPKLLPNKKEEIIVYCANVY